MADSRLFCVNLGCGSRFHPDWVNFDLKPIAPAIRQANFISGIPLPSASASCVYHSHVLEHLPPEIARLFLKECFRVLAPQGILRVVVPDLEQSCRAYIDAIDRRRADEPFARSHHEWMIIELIDQMVRTRPGGLLGRRAEGDADADGFIASRLGFYGRHMRRQPADSVQAPVRPQRLVRVMDALERWRFGRWGPLLANMLFRSVGEHHLWMYDELSLADLMREVGFININRMTHATSGIAGWKTFGLDAEADGSPYKAVSLYMEGVKPAAPEASADAGKTLPK